ncbi:chemotaxis protein CheW [Chitinibacter sp. SCUT-21]|uniref:chemotaxis protein CheW n=1 Tax=Chitinibacter sp. SCUT-21 TaxID=2970891 RepID=UPI0035A5B47F
MAKRISLREYQQGVMDRLQSVAAVAQVDACLGIMIGTENWLVDLADVAEVMPVPAIASVPLGFAWFKGVANIRGNLVSVTDLPAFFGLPHPGFTAMSRLVLLQPRHLPHAAVLVNRMLGLKHVADLTLLPAAVDKKPWVGDVYQDAAGQNWKTLDVAALVGQPSFLQTGIA